MRNFWNFFVVLGMSLLLCACATRGGEIKQSQLALLKPGVTTMKDVLSEFGQPTGKTVQADGMSHLFYNYTNARTNPAEFIPVVHLFVSHDSDMHRSSVDVTFDANGVLKDYTGNEAGAHTNGGTGSSSSVPAATTSEGETASPR